MDKKILVCYPMPQAGINILNQQFTQQQVDIYTELAQENLKDIISDYNAIIIQSNLWIDEGILKAATKLEIIALAQVGLEKIDIQAAKDRNIKVVNSKANVPSTAEFTMALMLDIARGITATAKLIQSGRFEELERFKKLKQIPGRQVTGATLGIIGLGDIGIELAKKAARGFNMKLIPYNRESENARGNAKELDCELCTDLQYLLKNSDFVTIHLPKNKTDNFINQENLQQMKKTAFLINTSRGGIINEAALLEALKNDIIAGAALDVFEFEENPNLPPQISEDLINFAESNPNKLLLSPHRGARTEEAQENAAIEVANQVCNFLCPH